MFIVTAAVILLILSYIFLPNIYAFKGSLAYQKQKTDSAIADYKKAVRTGRASPAIRLRYAMMLLRNGYPEEALQNFNEIIIDPKMGNKEKNTAKQYRCMAYIKLGNIKDALADSLELLSRYKNSGLYAIAGYAMILSEKTSDEILSFCENAYQYNPDNRDIADNYAVALIEAGQYTKAIEVCDKLTAKNRFFPEGHYHKALALFKLGKTKEASAELDLLEDCDFVYLTTVPDEEIETLSKAVSEQKGN